MALANLQSNTVLLLHLKTQKVVARFLLNLTSLEETPVLTLGEKVDRDNSGVIINNSLYNTHPIYQGPIDTQGYPLGPSLLSRLALH